ncbi:Bax inhibitor-1/YccA family protein, partial [Ruminococcus sp.]|uniref:Bax inhibitor-1/YccA family membrane protein n=1 Tax=Ruminococcus sp. TaxID=41978 RepID=UPI00265CA49A
LNIFISFFGLPQLLTKNLFIIIAALFLISDFQIIRETVENQRPKEYEWSVSFGLAFTVIWLYFKVLDLLIRIYDAKN